MLSQSLREMNNSWSMIFVSLPVIIKVEQQMEQGLWIWNHASLVVMRVEQRVEHDRCYFFRQPCIAYIVRVDPQQTMVSFRSLKTMFRLLSYELNESWNIVSVSSMGYHTQPVVMTI